MHPWIVKLFMAIWTADTAGVSVVQANNSSKIQGNVYDMHRPNQKTTTNKCILYYEVKGSDEPNCPEFSST